MDWRGRRVLSLERRLQDWRGRRVLSLERRLQEDVPVHHPAGPRAQAALPSLHLPLGVLLWKAERRLGAGCLPRAQPLGLETP